MQDLRFMYGTIIEYKRTMNKIGIGFAASNGKIDCRMIYKIEMGIKYKVNE